MGLQLGSLSTRGQILREGINMVVLKMCLLFHVTPVSKEGLPRWHWG